MHMDITPYVESHRSSLVSAADSAGDETRQAAERLGFALDSSARLAIMEAVSQAAAEITAEMPNGGVDVRLNGRDLDFLVHVAAPTPPSPPGPPSRPPPRRPRRPRRHPRTSTTATWPASRSASRSRSRPRPRSV